MTVVTPPRAEATAAATRPSAGRRRLPLASRFGRAVTALLLVLGALVTLFPFYAMVILSFKPQGAIEIPGSLLPQSLTAELYDRIFSADGVLRWLFNTVIYSVVGVVFVLLLSSLAGYGFAKKRFPGREVMFWSFLAMLMVPYQITLIPLFILIAQAGGVDTYWGLVVPTFANATGVFLLRQFISTIPDELIEAARMDGCSDWRIYWQIVIPLCKPILATLGVFVFLWHWNDFLWPLLVGQDTSMQTLTVGIASLHKQERTSLNEVMAGAVVAAVPLFVAYLFGQRYLTEGVMSSGIKG
ncbi:carbohydrate ABC transporter membrane protein 2, CUT1 family [Micromonospora rhizosphaerae]|uniref:Carbohydrate ABC transporter membrane protein 2, CUT1 family n=1 Tax=Micromonospora rhizosphaerae TaxID=568872 RepID=A0A1C6SBF5_9ACTN|nr:carbohydrate ABC transporter permease [Micromonospora rhizosphaerae]SCL26724.1 carbohydrate ABC transporter membrane protein 2, CUT1 family [Micromonospora rhizosphaerae]